MEMINWDLNLCCEGKIIDITIPLPSCILSNIWYIGKWVAWVGCRHNVFFYKPFSQNKVFQVCLCLALLLLFWFFFHKIVHRIVELHLGAVYIIVHFHSVATLSFFYQQVFFKIWLLYSLEFQLLSSDKKCSTVEFESCSTLNPSLFILP